MLSFLSKFLKETKGQLFLIFGLFSGLKGSLQRLQLEYVDVVFANRPDSNTPMEGEWRNLIKASPVIDSSSATYSTLNRKWNIFRLISLNMKNKNLSSWCLSASVFTLKAKAVYPASYQSSRCRHWESLQGEGAHFLKVYFTSVISSSKTIKLIGRGVYNPATLFWSRSPQGLPIL